MTDIFTLRKIPYNICSVRLFRSENPRSMHFGVDAIAFRASQLWQKVPIAIKDSSSLEIFKAKIKLSTCNDCPCNLCKRFIANVGYIYNQYDCFCNQGHRSLKCYSSSSARIENKIEYSPHLRWLFSVA